MYKWKPHDINNPFKTRQGEKIINLDRYVEVLNENNIPFSKFLVPVYKNIFLKTVVYFYF